MSRHPIDARGFQPLDQAPGRESPATGVFALGVVLLVLAGSLSPFGFDLAAARANGGVGPAAIGWPPSGHHDLLTNFGIYLPIGTALCLWLRGHFRAVAAWSLAGVLGGLISLIAESLQTCIPLRTASWIDVTVNLVGALCGAAIAPVFSAVAGAAVRRLREGLAHKPMSTTAGVLAAGLLVMGLCPFDFVTTSPALHASLARSRWSLFAPGADEGAAGFAAADVSAIGVAGIFLALGFFLALGWREHRHPRYRAWAASMLHLALLAILIESVQIFVVSRSFDLRDALLNVLGGALGTYLAIWAVDAPSRSAWLTRPAVLLHPLLVGPALALQVAHHLLSAVAWPGPSTSLAAGSVVLWVPFSGYYGRSLTSVAGHVLSVWVGFALLALTVALLARGLGRRACWWAAAGTVLAVAAGAELIQFTQPGRVADVTDPLLALTSALIVVWAYRYLAVDGLKLAGSSAS